MPQVAKMRLVVQEDAIVEKEMRSKPKSGMVRRCGRLSPARTHISAWAAYSEKRRGYRVGSGI